MKHTQDDVINIMAANEMVNTFATDFKARFGVSPHIYYNLKGKDTKVILTLNEIYEICNNIYKQDSPIYVGKEQGLKVKSRDRITVLYRQVYFKLARNMSYPLAYVSGMVNKHHSTVIHGIKLIDELLESDKYDDVNEIYNKLNDAIQTALYFKRRAQHVPEAQVVT